MYQNKSFFDLNQIPNINFLYAQNMKYIPLMIIIILLVIVTRSVSFSDKHLVIGHGYSQEKITEIRKNIFSGREKITTLH